MPFISKTQSSSKGEEAFKADETSRQLRSVQAYAQDLHHERADTICRPFNTRCKTSSTGPLSTPSSTLESTLSTGESSRSVGRDAWSEDHFLSQGQPPTPERLLIGERKRSSRMQSYKSVTSRLNLLHKPWKNSTSTPHHPSHSSLKRVLLRTNDH